MISPAARPLRQIRPPAMALVGACHPLPTAGVTAVTAGLAAVAGLSFGRGLLLTLAVFTGQLSIGWSNDWIDAARDRAVARIDKPVAQGAVSARQVAAAAGVALVATVALSVLLGWRSGLAALTIVVCGWLYNVGLKATAISFVPYAIAFGMLPAAATLAGTPPAWAAGWALAAGALLGVGAHFANVLPDLASDAATGVRGLPHLLGASATAVGAPVLLLAASVTILLGADDLEKAWGYTVLVLLAVGAVTGAVAGFRRPGSRVLFLTSLLVAGADLALFAFSGRALT